MSDVRPFRALRPPAELAERVIALPYDVLSEDQARGLAINRHSFVRVTRSEVDLPVGTDPHSEQTYAMARANLDGFVREGMLVRDARPTYYFYGQRMGTHEQVGVLAGASVDEYDLGGIARHEFTRPDKEDDRTHHLDVLDAQVGLVFLTYRPDATLRRLTAQVTALPPAWSVTTEDDVVHTFWLAPQSLNAPIQQAFGALERLYIADGHHRSAAASRIHALRGCGPSRFFLAGLFPADSLQVMAYNRVVEDLNGHTVEAFLARVREGFAVANCRGGVPSSRGEFRMYLAGEWYRLKALSPVPEQDPVARLDVSVLQERLLAPILGIKDIRTSSRVQFVGGIHGSSALEARVDAGAAVAFHLYPTSLDELFAVADVGEVMPPKSTWFEPKLREGVVIRKLDED
jgi:uncharacterized protein (DUF1015 family)